MGCCCVSKQLQGPWKELIKPFPSSSPHAAQQGQPLHFYTSFENWKCNETKELLSEEQGRGRAESCYLHHRMINKKRSWYPENTTIFLQDDSGGFSKCKYKLLVYTHITNYNKIKTKSVRKLTKQSHSPPCVQIYTDSVGILSYFRALNRDYNYSEVLQDTRWSSTSIWQRMCLWRGGLCVGTQGLEIKITEASIT